MLFIHEALNADGSVNAVSSGTPTSYLGGHAYVESAPLVTTQAVADTDAVQGGFRRSPLGALRLHDATLGLPDTVTYQEGIAVTPKGQVCAVLGAVDTDNVVRLAGMAMTHDGRPYIVIP